MAQQQSANYKILFPSLAKALINKYEVKDIDKDFIDFVSEILIEAVSDKERYFNADRRILEDSLLNHRSGAASFDNRYKFIDLLIISSRDVNDIDSFNKDLVKFYNYCVDNQLNYQDDQFIGICAYLNAHPDYAEEKLEEIASAQKKLKIHFNL